ncbi:hypothetical protein [Pseudomonas sp. 250J]|uniref:hypothetical protein n=1 Tax=Pseudomonas sp. 250J TaxID=1478142 RepID=UPI000A4B6397|nr:hypothetical protein [Pseudomonas sp. 250J]
MDKPKSTKNQKKEESESLVLAKATETLKAIYKDFDIDPDQKDKPDKAIILKKPPARFGKKRTTQVKIGIEVTTVDPNGYLSYMSNRKRDQEAIVKQIDDVMETGEPTNPLKKITTTIYDSWLYEGLIAKKEKHESYAIDRKFEELILLCHSDIISVKKLRSDKILLEHTQHLLKKDDFPFDKVIFVDSRENDAIQIYNKLEKEKPPRYTDRDENLKSVDFGMLPVGKPLNLLDIASRDPIIKPPKPVVDRRKDSDPTHK